MNAKDEAAGTPIVDHSAAPRNRAAGAAEVKREAEKKEGDRILRSEALSRQRVDIGACGVWPSSTS